MKFFQIILIALVCLLFHCCREAQQKERVKNSEILENSSNQDSLQPAMHGKARFQSFRGLINFYNKQTDSLEQLRITAFKDFKNKPPAYGDSIALIESEYYGLIEERNKFIFEYLEENEKNSDNMMGIIYLVVDHKIPILSIDSLFKQFPLHLRNSERGKLFFAKIDERKKTEKASSYDPALLSLKFESGSGSQTSLNNIDSRYILLDFWASWCAPCRYENRKMVKEKTQIIDDADVTIVAVSLDKDRNKWIKATNDDKLNYLTICDFKEFESPLAKGMKIEVVPYNLLIDKEGKIIARNLWGNELKEFLRTLK